MSKNNIDKMRLHQFNPIKKNFKRKPKQNQVTWGIKFQNSVNWLGFHWKYGCDNANEAEQLCKFYKETFGFKNFEICQFIVKVDVDGTPYHHICMSHRSKVNV